MRSPFTANPKNQTHLRPTFRFTSLWATLVLALLGGAWPALAGTLTVTNTNDSGPGSLRQAIADAAPGDTIGFAITGTIALTSGQLLIDKGLTVDGPGAEQLAITGSAAPAFRVFEVSPAVTAAIQNLTISGGTADVGGGILNWGTLTVSHCTLSGNQAGTNYEQGGGAIANGPQATLTVDQCAISENAAGWGGGGILNKGGVLTVSNSRVSGNSADFGGGIFNYSNGTLTVQDSNVSDNSAIHAGGIYSGGTLTASGSVISGNSAGGLGGGIHGYGTLALSNCLVSDNQAATGGGIQGFNSLQFEGCTISGNSATYGGAISGGEIVSMNHCTIANNSAAVAGGFDLAGSSASWTVSSSTLAGNSGIAAVLSQTEGTITFINCTISGNDAGPTESCIFTFMGTINMSSTTIADNVSGVGAIASYEATINLKNTVIANQGPNFQNYGGLDPSLSGVNLVNDATIPGATQVTAAALNLGPLADNGGPTKTHALQPGSVAFDAATDCTDWFGHPVTKDQRGVKRAQGAACDVGAYETPRRAGQFRYMSVTP